MFSKIVSCAIEGIYGYVVTVEADLSSGFPAFTIVGMPDIAVKESRERVTSALRNSGFGLPVRKITVNLAPAAIKKEGALFDLPIALGILAAEGVLSDAACAATAFAGELALDGGLRPVRGALPMAMAMAKKGYGRFVLPSANAPEASLVEKLRAIGVESLSDTVAYLRGLKNIEPTSPPPFPSDGGVAQCELDFADVKGQGHARRAAEVAAAGGHNILMIGPPGSGKTMLARRIPGIIPPMNYEEAVDVTRIHSVTGHAASSGGLVRQRPFRSPHHTVSDVALIGGGTNPRPGEVSLAHRGVLFLDELPEFDRNVLEVLRQPLEDRKVTVSRAKNTLSFPASFMLVAAMNPCPCGNYGHPEKECVCTPWQIRKYLAKISGPLLDRIDIHAEVPALRSSEMLSEHQENCRPATPDSGFTTAELRRRVISARLRQAQRRQAGLNAVLGPSALKKHCALSPDCRRFLAAAVEKLGLSARGCDKVVKVARTVADIASSETIETHHLAEAVSYRSLDKFAV